ncbi:MAG: ABC transporter permease [Lachnospiraceae bacterium]|jgi:ABC-2 type transport system permease protein|nr:ABC transporter permease [Lachnospiraceae bacterium]
MTVFRGFITIVKRNIAMNMIYLVIFLAIAIIAQKMSAGDQAKQFEQTSLKMAVIDEANTTLSKGLKTYLGQFNTLVDLPNEKSVLQERLFYRDVEYILTIPKGFDIDAQGNVTEELKVTKLPGTIMAFYADEQVNGFIDEYRLLLTGGYTPDEAAKKALELTEITPTVNMVTAESKRAEWAGYSYMFQYLPYVILAMTVMTLGSIMMEFYKTTVRRRMRCSALSNARRNIEFFFGYMLFGTVIWAIFSILPLIMYGKALLEDGNLGFYLLNSFVLVLIALSLTVLLGLFVKKPELLSAAVNVVSLGMSFLCGVFIPVTMLDKNVTMISKFLPVYWYETTLQVLADNKILSGDTLTSVWRGIGIQLMFVAAFLALAMVIGKTQEKEK